MDKVPALISFSFGRFEEDLELASSVLKLFGESVETTFRVDSLCGTFSLNQDFREIHTLIDTSFGPVYFSNLSEEDNNYIINLWGEGKLDIIVHYEVPNVKGSDTKYFLHTSFPPEEVVEALCELTGQEID